MDLNYSVTTPSGPKNSTPLPDSVLKLYNNWGIPGEKEPNEWVQSPDFHTKVYGHRAPRQFLDDIRLEPCRYQNSEGDILSHEEFYQNILRPVHLADAPHGCRNEAILDCFFPEIDGERHVTMYFMNLRVITIGIVHGLFAIARASFLQHCTCVLPDSVLACVPRCPSWPGFDSWAMQLLACGSREMPNGTHSFTDGPSSPYYKELMEGLGRIIEINVPRPERGVSDIDRVKWQLDPEYQIWEQGVDHSELCHLVSWMTGLVDAYEPLQPWPDNTAIFKAAERGERIGLCPRRLWAVTTTCPNGENALPVLVPDITSHPLGGTHLGWRNVGHEICTADLCAFDNLNFTAVPQLHVCPDKSCAQTLGLFPKATLERAVELQHQSSEIYIPTAWGFDGLSMVEPGQPYMAISHVWSDGTGNGTWPAGVVNQCLYDFFCEKARLLGCLGIWWDAICIPTNRKLRADAINSMHRNYEYATHTLVHDTYLTSFEWLGASSACFAVLMSSWFSRGWTALELARSPSVKVLFSDGKPRDLDSEVLAGEGDISYPYHRYASALIRHFRGPIKDINHLISAFGPRYTSWTRDKAIIAGLLVGTPSPAHKEQQEVYQDIMKQLGNVWWTNLCHGMTTMKTEAFTWCPTDIFRLPVHKKITFTNKCIVEDTGRVKNYCRIICLAKWKKSVIIPTETIHPFIRVKLQLALNDTRRHLVLVEHGFTRSKQALIVRVNPDDYTVPIKCELVGPVTLRSDVVTCMPRISLEVYIGTLSEPPTDIPTRRPCDILCLSFQKPKKCCP